MRLNRVNGVIAVNKPKGLLSGDVVEYIKHYLTRLHGEDQDKGKNSTWKVPDLQFYYDNADQKRKMVKWPYKIKIGHGGTLDPLAAGVLIIGIGTGTKSLQYFLNGNECVKVYEAVGQLGFATDTYDSTGKQVGETRPFDHIKSDAVNAMIKDKFVGEIMQKPPMYSAIRVNGQRLYDIARSGDVAAQQAVEIKARPVRVMQCELVDGRVDENGQFRLRIQCGGGCYIRSIIHDLAQELGTAAHMTELVRVRQGLFSLPGACGGVGDEETIPVLSVEQLTEYEALCGFIEMHESQIDAYVKRCAASVASTQQAAKQHNNKRNASPAKDRSPFIKQKCEPSEDIAGGTNASADINI